MRFVGGGLNGVYLREISSSCLRTCEEVRAAVVYADVSGATELTDGCKQEQVRLMYYGLLEYPGAISPPVLERFLSDTQGCSPAGS